MDDSLKKSDSCVEALSVTEVTTNERPEERNSILGEVVGALFSLPSSAEAESKTFGFKIDPFNIKGAQGQLFFRLEQLRFTIVRANLENGGKRCFMTMSWLTTTFGWTTQHGPTPLANFDMNVLNSAGGVLMPWTFSRHFLCRTEQEPWTFVYEKIDPQFYEIIAGANFRNQSATVYKC
ncbi:hypothetical protein PTE30175_04803 [Pandoraea terrae]|uniref:Uncharacterized protein n=1 Tax=Pandoraea terrae TaxID=1537710 RepID=A0A5E4YYS1_9BURK|nr:hypothetical protein [Pandoraea terrae]VVE54101.1 hypothetical protein PTE30175_04803 [Pandoraea terrae]